MYFCYLGVLLGRETLEYDIYMKMPKRAHNMNIHKLRRLSQVHVLWEYSHNL